MAIDKDSARAYLSAEVDYSADFHALPSESVDALVRYAKAHGYRLPKNANGSLARYFFAMLTRPSYETQHVVQGHYGQSQMAQNQIFRGTARNILKNEDGTFYFYHNTAIVRVGADKSIKLDSAGYRTATTKTAINQASNQFNLGFQVFQKAHEWFVTWQGETLPFADGMILTKRDFSEDEDN